MHQNYLHFYKYFSLNLQNKQKKYRAMRKVTYLYNDQITRFQFSKEHFMKPKRIKMAHSLVRSSGLAEGLTIIKSKQASALELQEFHSPEYIKYLESWVTGVPMVAEVSSKDPEAQHHFVKDAELGAKFSVNQILDCPGFEGLFHFCQLAAGGSIDAADVVNTGFGDIVLNWSGGYHHAHKCSASGFCYVNDIVLCILELLKFNSRVLYLDIDVHHGDGVEEAFYNTNRVMTVSFHQHQPGFFPQTGGIQSVGEGLGKYFSINIPLKKGMDDLSYFQLFKEVMDRVMASYRPEAVVVQCGADSLSGDKLGSLNLSIRGHSTCLQYMKTFNVPLILLGGGGYTIENVARCWAYQTGRMMGVEIDNEIAKTDKFYYYYTKDDYKIHFPIDSMSNCNSKQYLGEIVERVTENIRGSEGRPSVQFHYPPPSFRQEESMSKKIVRSRMDNYDSIFE